MKRKVFAAILVASMAMVAESSEPVNLVIDKTMEASREEQTDLDEVLNTNIVYIVNDRFFDSDVFQI